MAGQERRSGPHTTPHPARKRTGPRLEWLFWLCVFAFTTIGMAWVRGSLGIAHVVLAYVLVVLGASAREGRVLGLSVAVVALGRFTFFLVVPYHTFAVTAPLDWLVLLAFLATSAVAARLLERARVDAAEAGRRSEEVDRPQRK